MKKSFIKSSNILIAGIILLIILSFFGFFGPFENAIAFVLRPFQSAYQAVARGASSAYVSVFRRDEIMGRLKELEGEVQNLAVDYVELSALKEENVLLKKQLDFTEANDYATVSAKVLTYISSPHEKYMVINRGLSDGIQAGYPVISGEGLIIGRILEAHDHLAEVRLVTDPRSKIPVKILGADKTIGIASGSYGSIIRMELIPVQENIKADDLVVTSNLEENIPAGLIVGVINEIIVSGNEPFKTALVEPLADFYAIGMISVIIPSHD
ncbi:MAG: rod shape-determining protein MreC [Patescibacteria group bacterium]|nr:rod shape-determining protein MreC [Patescibacteria group bacterium]